MYSKVYPLLQSSLKSYRILYLIFSVVKYYIASDETEEEDEIAEKEENKTSGFSNAEILKQVPWEFRCWALPMEPMNPWSQWFHGPVGPGQCGKTVASFPKQCSFQKQ